MPSFPKRLLSLVIVAAAAIAGKVIGTAPQPEPPREEARAYGRGAGVWTDSPVPVRAGRPDRLLLSGGHLEDAALRGDHDPADRRRGLRRRAGLVAGRYADRVRQQRGFLRRAVAGHPGRGRGTGGRPQGSDCRWRARVRPRRHTLARPIPARRDGGARSGGSTSTPASSRPCRPELRPGRLALSHDGRWIAFTTTQDDPASRPATTGPRPTSGRYRPRAERRRNSSDSRPASTSSAGAPATGPSTLRPSGGRPHRPLGDPPRRPGPRRPAAHVRRWPTKIVPASRAMAAGSSSPTTAWARPR